MAAPLRVGQVIAIPVLTRHITHSSGVCQQEDINYDTSCVMADALRDRFPGATGVSVGPHTTWFRLNDTEVELSNGKDMHAAVQAFDDAMSERLVDREFTSRVRAAIAPVVHATVADLL